MSKPHIFIAIIISIIITACDGNCSQGNPTTYSSAKSTVSGGVLIAGEVAVIDTSGSTNPGSSLIITNAGNASVTLGSSSSSTGISNLAGCSSGSILNSGESCTITFTVTQDGGTGTITLNYTNSNTQYSITQAINWYNSLNGALLSMNYTTPLSIPQSTTETETVTVTNAGGYNLTNVTISAPSTLSGSAVVTISYPSTNSCNNANLSIGQSCQFILNIIDNNVDTNAQILLGVTGKYNNGSSQTYSRLAILTYSIISNTYLYNTNLNSATLTGYLVNSNTGALSNLSPASYNLSTYGYTVATTPNKQYLYATCYATGQGVDNIYAYSVNQNNGELTAINGIPFDSEGTTPYYPVVTPNGKFMYVGNLNNIAGFSIEADGSLTSVTGSPFIPPVENTGNLIIDATGNFLYTYAGGSIYEPVSLLEYSIDQISGTLTLIGTATAGQIFATIQIAPNNKFFYAASTGSNALYSYVIESNGTLTASGSYSANSPFFMVLTSDSKFLYAIDVNINAISAYSIDPNTGVLTLINGSPFVTTTTSDAPYYTIITANNQFLYVSNSGGYPNYSPATISAFAIESNGALSKINEYPTSNGGGIFLLDSTSNFLYLLSQLTNSISGYIINPSTGELTNISGSPFATGTYPYSGILFNS